MVKSFNVGFPGEFEIQENLKNESDYGEVMQIESYISVISSAILNFPTNSA